MNDVKNNQALWDELTTIHIKSAHYDVESFKKGKSSLKLVEIKELGCVTNKSILHLQCHFGLDTMSLSRIGADVTGVDFSPRSIKFANTLSRKLGI